MIGKMIYSKDGNMGVLVETLGNGDVRGTLMKRDNADDLFETVDREYPSGYVGNCVVLAYNEDHMMDCLESASAAYDIEWPEW